MAFDFRPAAREHVGLLIGLAGPSGSGKTYTALRLATGIAGAAPFCVIDTEARRAKHYADQFRFDHGDLEQPFTPARYAEALKAADAAKYPVIVVDSMSHEWAGNGGILDMQEDEYARLGNREAVKMLSWAGPKREHKRLVYQLLQLEAHVIFCFRAEPKIEMVKGSGGQWEIREKQSLTGAHGLIPVTEKSLPYELTVSIMLTPERPGIPIPIKLQAQHKALFPLEQQITEATGAGLAAWARGASAPTPPPLVVDWLARIEAAKTKAELKAIGADLKKHTDSIPSPLLVTLRAAYDARQKASR